jgi:uncharacterized lipoprotein YmbA
MTQDALTRRTLVLAGCALLLAGCSILKPRPDGSQFFELTRTSDAQTSDADARSNTAAPANPDGFPGLSVGLGPIILPEYLDRREIATRVNATQIVYSPTNCWVESLDVSIRRIVSENLSALLGTDEIVSYPWLGNARPRYQVEIEILRLDSNPAGDAELLARWAIKDASGKQYVVVRRSSLSRPATSAGASAAVSALSGTLGDLSQEIVGALEQLPGLPAREPRSTLPSRARVAGQASQNGPTWTDSSAE